MKPSSHFFAAFVLCCTCFLLLPQAASSQDFSSIDSDLQELETLITDTLLNSEAQQTQLENLKTNLADSGNLIEAYEITITGQEQLLMNLRTHLNEMSKIYKTQSDLSAKYEKSSKFWKTFTLIAIPVTAILSGGAVWAIIQK